MASPRRDRRSNRCGSMACARIGPAPRSRAARPPARRPPTLPTLCRYRRAVIRTKCARALCASRAGRPPSHATLGWFCCALSLCQARSTVTHMSQANHRSGISIPFLQRGVWATSLGRGNFALGNILPLFRGTLPMWGMSGSVMSPAACVGIWQADHAATERQRARRVRGSA